MRAAAVILLWIGSLGLSGCVPPLSSQPTSTRWTTGFWFWKGSSLDPAYSGKVLDVVFVQVGTISKDTLPGYLRSTTAPLEQWNAYGELPAELPPARDYWLVYRYTNQGVPDIQVATMVAAEINRLQADVVERRIHVVGVQLDIDCPTSSLQRYAGFIYTMRKALPDGMQVSITALLDWFRNGTAIGDVLAQVDEFVPQFYDLGDPAGRNQAAIAARIDALRWAPVFNRYGKRFRIGISTFGRARLVPRDQPMHRGITFYGDLRPLDVAANPAFELQTSHNAAGETVLNYRAKRNVRLGYERLQEGDIVQFIISTPEAIRAAVGSARKIKGHMAGVVFFRWPSEREDWAMQPDEVLDAAGVGGARRHENHVHVVAGDCAAVHCVDLYLESAGPLSPRTIRYRIHASTALEYFLPEPNMPLNLVGSSDFEISLPAYCGRGHLYIGRAVSLERAEFTVEEKR